MLFTGIKYFYLFESHFKPKDNFDKGDKYGKNLLISSFVIGLLLVIIFTFKPAQMSEHSELNWDYAKYSLYGLFIILLVINAFVSIKKYELKSGLTRLLLLSFLMVLYFYTGMLGGLFVIATFAMFILIFAIVKFKNVLTIK